MNEHVAKKANSDQALESLRAHLERGLDDIGRRVATVPNIGKALERDLARLKAQINTDLATLGSIWASGERDGSLETESQALRQEVAQLQLAVADKDRTLDNLAQQCRTLEDALEDRELALERLQRAPPHAVSTSSLAVAPLPAPIPAAAPAKPSYSLQDFLLLPPTESHSLAKFFAGHLRRKVLVWAASGLLGIGMVVGFGQLLSRIQLAPEVGEQLPSVKPAQLPTRTAATDAAPTREVARAVVVTDRPALRFVRDSLRHGGDGPELAYLPGERFSMGSRLGLLTVEEQPVHEVQISPFYLGRYEVSFEEYDRFAQSQTRALPDDAGWGRANRPVVHVSWEDAQAYVHWLTAETGQNYRLPSEAEWEYAARAGTTTRFYWGASLEPGRAVCFDCGSPWDNRSTVPVGTLPPNPFGLYEMAGNAMEWVQDCYHKDYQGAPEDGRPWLDGDCSQRMVRSGAFNKPANSIRPSARFALSKDARLVMLGFRVARS